MPRLLLLAAIAMVIGGRAGAQDRPVSEEIGSWVLSCPDAKTAPCQLRLQSSIMQPGGNGPSASLEVVHRGDLFVPVVALRGVSMQAAIGGVLAVQTNVALRFDAQPWTEIACNLDGAAVVCAPAPDTAALAAAALSDAHSRTGARADYVARRDGVARTVAFARSARHGPGIGALPCQRAGERVGAGDRRTGLAGLP